jgi:CCR4-NOT transcriptional complex subunit CAF120
MLQSYNPPQVEVSQDTPPELQPIFSFLNSHSNKLYTEGYFLKLHDLDSRGRPSTDRTWIESFAQLIGTVLSLWDANALDAAGEDGEVVPTFVNLSDASVKIVGRRRKV